jgi:hypothetical protein
LGGADAVGALDAGAGCCSARRRSQARCAGVAPRRPPMTARSRAPSITLSRWCDVAVKPGLTFHGLLTAQDLDDHRRRFPRSRKPHGWGTSWGIGSDAGALLPASSPNPTPAARGLAGPQGQSRRRQSAATRMAGDRDMTTDPPDRAAPRCAGHHGAGLSAPGSGTGLGSRDWGEPLASRAQCGQQ